ncbi:uncharacterized protein LOC124891286 [Capsicum annuum]|uniref:uncharacterized protein LOC124891286 n=1 Tax=Capsicum annuum TaxID=4072 RepID=UPI0007BEBC78|nr:uncharacterized protein LOC124891286 [Capsicum annuum]
MNGETNFSSMTPPTFDGESYQIWAVRMRIYLQALDLWEVVEDEYEIAPLPENPMVAQIKTHKERKTRKSKALACVFTTVSSNIFTRIMSLKSAKEVWNYLNTEYEGDERIRELLSVFKAQEQQRVMRQGGAIEGALPSKHHDDGCSKKKKKNKNNQPTNEEGAAHNNKNKTSDFKGKYSPCKHCGKLGHAPFKCWKRPDAKCTKYNHLGHEAIICKNKTHYQDAEARVVNEQEKDQLFDASCFTNNISSESWLIDSGCTNHMTHDEEIFKYIDKSAISKVRIGKGDYLSAKGKGIVAIESRSGTKLISDVLFVPELDQNLLTVGQLLENGFKLNFGDKKCVIFDPKG